MYGIFYLFLISFLIFAALCIFTYTPASKLATFSRYALPIGTIMIGSVLSLAGRGLVGLPLIGMGLAWWQRIRALNAANKLQDAIIKTDELELNISKTKNGPNALSGKLLTADFEGKFLSQLTTAQMFDCFGSLKGESAALLEAYLDCKFPAWREDAKLDLTPWKGDPSSTSAMTQHEANQVLGLRANATTQQARDAHALLVERINPDGASANLLISKLNDALVALGG